MASNHSHTYKWLWTQSTHYTDMFTRLPERILNISTTNTAPFETLHCTHHGNDTRDPLSLSVSQGDRASDLRGGLLGEVLSREMGAL